MGSSLPSEIRRAIESQTNARINNFSVAGGGCINHGGRLDTTNGTFFLKWNDRKKYPGMFSAEVKGLRTLGDARSLKVPEVILVSETDENQFLMLEYIEQSDRKENYWEHFGSGLAEIHRRTQKHFGLDHDNYIGSLRQHNTPASSWMEFFIQQRLNVQLERAVDSRKMDPLVLTMFEKLFGKLPTLLPDEPPSLLHGDLWGGNIMVSGEGDPCLIDPAVYYGHREMDLAMTALFGGFDPIYQESYNEAYPLQPGFNERVDIHNLYPLLVHVNLFGGGYVTQALTIVKRFV